MATLLLGSTLPMAHSLHFKAKSALRTVVHARPDAMGDRRLAKGSRVLSLWSFICFGLKPTLFDSLHVEFKRLVLVRSACCEVGPHALLLCTAAWNSLDVQCERVLVHVIHCWGLRKDVLSYAGVDLLLGGVGWSTPGRASSLLRVRPDAAGGSSDAFLSTVVLSSGAVPFLVSLLVNL